MVVGLPPEPSSGTGSPDRSRGFDDHRPHRLSRKGFFSRELTVTKKILPTIPPNAGDCGRTAANT